MSNDLARRAVACKHWRWAPGMLSRCSTDTRRAVYRWLVGLDTRHYGLVCIVEDKHGRPCRNVATLQPGPDDLPDLDDEATLGCLLGLVRLARLDPYWLPTCLDWEGGMAWVIEAPSRKRQTRHGSYAAVLVAALEAAD
jgi:hypothetical protein